MDLYGRSSVATPPSRGGIIQGQRGAATEGQRGAATEGRPYKVGGYSLAESLLQGTRNWIVNR
jgi:hypothetical protein